jgi:hypothetical protein
MVETFPFGVFVAGEGISYFPSLNEARQYLKKMKREHFYVVLFRTGHGTA